MELNLNFKNILFRKRKISKSLSKYFDCSISCQRTRSFMRFRSSDRILLYIILYHIPLSLISIKFLHCMQFDLMKSESAFSGIYDTFHVKCEMNIQAIRCDVSSEKKCESAFPVTIYDLEKIPPAVACQFHVVGD